MTIFCVWLGWQVYIVRERKQLREWMRDGRAWQVAEVLAPYDAPNRHIPPLHRRLFGDFTLVAASIRPEVTRDELERLQRVFPEGEILQAPISVGLVY